ncbi:alanine:cation symporter family protein, partial [Staphylococcus simulans]|uniref:alanine:cation symporter family protein n=1 Tax=Staphylococcus simulans TaxID=1286 RepID=UPI003F7D9890
IGVGIMAWLNIVGILVIQQPAFKVLKDYRRQVREGRDPHFDPRPLGIRNAEFWEERADAIAAGTWQDGLPGNRRRDEDDDDQRHVRVPVR